MGEHQPRGVYWILYHTWLFRPIKLQHLWDVTGRRPLSTYCKCLVFLMASSPLGAHTLHSIRISELLSQFNPLRCILVLQTPVSLTMVQLISQPLFCWSTVSAVHMQRVDTPRMEQCIQNLLIHKLLANPVPSDAPLPCSQAGICPHQYCECSSVFSQNYKYIYIAICSYTEGECIYRQKDILFVQVPVQMLLGNRNLASAQPDVGHLHSQM